MGQFADDKTNLTSHVLKTRYEYVQRRAARLGWTVSKFGGAQWQKWFEAGCPVVSDLEASLPAMPYEGDDELPRPRKLRK
jgi:hypothetical protein